jgi:hypothetical protein
MSIMLWIAKRFGTRHVWQGPKVYGVGYQLGDTIWMDPLEPLPMYGSAEHLPAEQQQQYEQQEIAADHVVVRPAVPQTEHQPEKHEYPVINSK